MKTKSTRSKAWSGGLCKGQSGGAWNDPEQLSLKVLMALVYMAGLVAFQRYTGLLNPSPSSTAISKTQRFSSQDALYWLKHYHPVTHGPSRMMRALLNVEEEGQIINSTSSNSTNATEEKAGGDPLFPPELFTPEQIKNGAVGFYILGVIYMFVALAIVCDEFFVPSLDVIIEKIGCSEDVAGATFMAAGGSAPELFTSIIGVFIAFSDVGIGTIVGSAVFNILFVIGMCALFSKTVLYLTWWPLLRDCTFYSVSLLTLIIFFIDEQIFWYEALGLLGIYFSYVAFMKVNLQAEAGFKRLIGANKVSDPGLVPNNTTNGQGHQGYTGVPVLHSGSHFHHGLLQLMIHTIDPMTDGGRIDEKAAQLHAITSLQAMLGKQQGSFAGGVNGNNSLTPQGPEGMGGEEEDPIEPLSMSWPDTWRKRITYLLVLPLVLPLWLTLPDTRKPESKKFFAITFIGSILWIAVFSYLMVWWATVTGEAFSIPPEVMGLTFLAAGTSIPDLFTSVIVARKGFGDMAVSSSVGSNIFDVTVGLPLPWFLFTLVFGKPVPVSAEGMVCSIVLLFLMLCGVFLSILLFKWKMTKFMGFSMFIFYFLFVIITLGFEYDLWSCPL